MIQENNKIQDDSQSLKMAVSGSYTIITKGTIIPDDFVIEAQIDRDKYVVEMGFKDEDKWYTELEYQVSAETVGAIVLGSTLYRDTRYRLRTKNDEKFDITKTTIAKIMNAGR